MKEFIHRLEKENELLRVKGFVDPVLEIAEIADRFSKQNRGKALLFENTGTNFPVLINAFGSEHRMCMALSVTSLDEFASQMKDIAKAVLSPKKNFLSKLKVIPVLGDIASWMPVTKRGKGSCQEIINLNPDLSELPILQCWPADGGRFITLPLVHTINPLTGVRNAGMYRMHVFSKNTTGMHWHKHKTGASHFEEYKKLGRKMPVAVALGGDPVYTYSATAPLPEGIDEYLLAGFLRKKKVELVPCITQKEILVPADADFIIEGYVDPSEPLKTEGPFGDHTGFYSLEDQYPVFHVTCITHKKEAIYPATIVGIPPQEDEWLGKATERIFIEPIRQTTIPELHDMDMPAAGTFHNLVIASIDKKFAGQAIKTMNALWGAGQMMFNKTLIIVDKSVNVHNYDEVMKAVLTHAHPKNDFIESRGPLDVLDHSSPTFAYGAKLGIDATEKREEEKNASPASSGNNASVISFLKSKGCLCYEPAKGIIISTINKKNLPLLTIREFLQKTINHAVKHLVVVDEAVHPEDLYTVCWLVTANIDPARDIIRSETDHTAFTIIDGTLKISESDHFPRPWPNIVVSNSATIQAVNSKWSSIFSVPFIASPSLKYSSLFLGTGAVAKLPR